MEQNHYRVLQIPIDATPEEIRAAYFDAARQFHPDVNPDPASREIFLQIQKAYDVLVDPVTRVEYDQKLPEGEKIRPAIQANLVYSRSALRALNEPQLIYALLDLVCLVEPDPSGLPPVHVCVVIDRSTSMSGERIEMVKHSVAQFLHKLRDQDMASIVTFSDRAETFIPPTLISEIPGLDSKLSMIYIGGATEIMQGMQLGISLLRQGAGRNSMMRYLILITDGHTYGDEGACYELARAASAEGISINTLGIGSEWNDDFLDRLASIGGGNTSYISKTKDLVDFFEKRAESAAMVYARNLNFEFATDAGIRMNYAFRIHPEISELPMTSPIPLGSLYYGSSIRLLFEFQVDPLDSDVDTVRLARGKLVLELASHLGQLHRILVGMRCPVIGEYVLESPPDALMDALSRLTLYRIQQKVRGEVESGENVKAARHLQQLATNLLARGERDLAHMMLTEADHIRHQNSFSLDGEKRIKYGTRALLLPPEAGSPTL